MTNGTKALLAALCVAAVSAAALRPHVLCEGFLPENDMRIPVDAVRVSAGGITEAQFNKVLDKIETHYAPIVKAKGGTLYMNRKWTDATVNASATQMFGYWAVNMYGGLARHDAVTEGGFALVACHEMGHHLGGAPKLNGWMQWLGMGKWATNEGGADYFATLKCLREVMPQADTRGLEALASSACASVHRTNEARAACEAGAAAGKSLAGLFAALRAGPQISFATPDTAVVRSMYDGHPQPQCRLDTYLAGALCSKPVSEAVADRDPNAGSCTRKQGHLTGLRPLCWYLPPADEPRGPVVSQLDPSLNQAVSARLGAMSAALESLQ